MLKGTPISFGQYDPAPVIAPAFPGNGFTVMDKEVAAKAFPQPLEGVTVMFPEVGPNVTRTEFVLAPEIIDAPAGSVHMYVAAFVTAATLYNTLYCPVHTVAKPEIAPAFAGIPGVTATAKEDVNPTPHGFSGRTTMVPPVEAKVTTIEFVPSPEVMAAPDGNVHVYVVAFATAGIEYETPACALHTEDKPVIVPALFGLELTVTVITFDETDLPQASEAFRT